MKMGEHAIKVGGLFRINKNLSSTVYAGQNIRTYEGVAIKLEKNNHHTTPDLQYEAMVWRKLRG